MLKNVWRRARIAQRCQQLSCSRFGGKSRQSSPEIRSKSPKLDDVENLREALGVTRIEFDRSGMQTDDIEQKLVRVTSLSDIRSLCAQQSPVRVDLAEYLPEIPEKSQL